MLRSILSVVFAVFLLSACMQWQVETYKDKVNEANKSFREDVVQETALAIEAANLRSQILGFYHGLGILNRGIVLAMAREHVDERTLVAIQLGVEQLSDYKTEDQIGIPNKIYENLFSNLARIAEQQEWPGHDVEALHKMTEVQKVLALTWEEWQTEGITREKLDKVRKSLKEARELNHSMLQALGKARLDSKKSKHKVL